MKKKYIFYVMSFTHYVTLGATKVAFALALARVLITNLLCSTNSVATTCLNRHKQHKHKLCNSFLLGILTFYVLYSISVRPGGYCRLTNPVKLIPRVELSDLTYCAY